jgi:hypothetical protein
MKPRLPRHAAGSFELKEGTGPITMVCPCGTFMEVYKADKTFRVQTPKSIDPLETNPNAPWVASPVSDVGSANLIVARVLLQAQEMLKGSLFDGAVDAESIVIHLHSCKEALVTCEKLSQRVGRSIDQITTQIAEHGVARDGRGRGLNPFPQVPDLEADCGTFLIQANRAIKQICELPHFFITLDRIDSNFDHLHKRLAAVIGEDAPPTILVRDNADTVRHLIDLRNFHEHPRQIRTIIENFRVCADGSINPPTWHLTSSDAPSRSPIKEELADITVYLRALAEAMTIHLVMQTVSSKFPYVIEETPDEKVDPALPIKYRLSLDITKLRVNGQSDRA